jgi:hypothetical protein
VVSPVLHNRLPAELADKAEVPQLSATVTTGADGIAFGAAMLEPAALVQPFAVWVTVYEPPVATVMEELVSPVLHNKEPPALVANTLLPQLLLTVTTGAAGAAVGVAMPDPAALVQPFTVWVTL